MRSSGSLVPLVVTWVRLWRRVVRFTRNIRRIMHTFIAFRSSRWKTRNSIRLTWLIRRGSLLWRSAMIVSIVRSACTVLIHSLLRRTTISARIRETRLKAYKRRITVRCVGSLRRVTIGARFVRVRLITVLGVTSARFLACRKLTPCASRNVQIAPRRNRNRECRKDVGIYWYTVREMASSRGV